MMTRLDGDLVAEKNAYPLFAEFLPNGPSAIPDNVRPILPRGYCLGVFA